MRFFLFLIRLFLDGKKEKVYYYKPYKPNILGEHRNE